MFFWSADTKNAGSIMRFAGYVATRSKAYLQVVEEITRTCQVHIVKKIDWVNVKLFHEWVSQIIIIRFVLGSLINSVVDFMFNFWGFLLK